MLRLWPYRAMRFFPLAAFVLALAACSAGDPASRIPGCSVKTGLPIGGPITLTSNRGERVTEDFFKGRKTLVFFGYTYCPDFCPRTLSAIGTAMTLLPKGVKKPMTAFISVDPARDTPAKVAEYLQTEAFPKRIVGLTGTQDELEAAAKGFGTSFERNDDPNSASGYLMSHGTILYLMDENWKLQTFFSQEMRPSDMAKCIAALSR
jgi:protein SCO1/2